MTLIEFIKELEYVAANQPAVNMIVRDSVYKMNEAPACKYGAFAWTQRQHAFAAGSDIQTFSFYLYYADRLVEDKSNLVEVQSVGVQTLNNVIKVLADEYDVADWQIDTFPAERFKDDCAGAYASVSFKVPATTSCGEHYIYPVGKGQFTEAFSDAFRVWTWQFGDKEVFVLK